MMTTEVARDLIQQLSDRGHTPLGDFPLGGHGLCAALWDRGASRAYDDMDAVFGVRLYGDDPESFGEPGDFNEHRQTALCFLAALSEDDLTYFRGFPRAVHPLTVT